VPELPHRVRHPRQTSASDIVIQARQFERLQRRIAALTAAHTGQTVERIPRTRSATARFTAHQALAYRFIDRVVDPMGQSVAG
jgi:ATP-dependent Clp protease protease subunit